MPVYGEIGKKPTLHKNTRASLIIDVDTMCVLCGIVKPHCAPLGNTTFLGHSGRRALDQVVATGGQIPDQTKIIPRFHTSSKFSTLSTSTKTPTKLGLRAWYKANWNEHWSEWETANLALAGINDLRIRINKHHWVPGKCSVRTKTQADGTACVTEGAFTTSACIS